VLRGAKIVFVDIRPDTMNIDENLIQKAITNKTKAIVPMHYAGVGCEMNKICEIADKYNLYIIEDAAQSVMARYNGKFLGTFGDIGCYSFHETKNITCGEGGAILLNNEKFLERVEIIHEKGTDRSKFLRNQVDKYTWQDIGSSYLPSELNAAYLYAQLENLEKVNNNRMKSWKSYYNGLQILVEKGYIEIPNVAEGCEHNAHLFYIKVKDLNQRTVIINYLKENGIQSVFHYVPLHSSPAGIRYGKFHGIDKYTTRESERLIRLPLWYKISEREINTVINAVKSFYGF